jgi:hypothetical protein
MMVAIRAAAEVIAAKIGGFVGGNPHAISLPRRAASSRIKPLRQHDEKGPGGGRRQLLHLLRRIWSRAGFDHI